MLADLWPPHTHMHTQTCTYTYNIYTQTRAREMAQQVRALAHRPEDLVLFPAPTCQVTTICNSSSKESKALSGSLGTTHVCDTRTYGKAPNTYKIKIKLPKIKLLEWSRRFSSDLVR